MCSNTKPAVSIICIIHYQRLHQQAHPLTSRKGTVQIKKKKNLKTEVYDRFQSLASLVSSAMLRVFKLEYTMHLCSCTYNLPGIIATLLLTRLVVFTHAQLRERNNGEIIKTAATMKYLGATLMQGMSLRAGT